MIKILPVTKCIRQAVLARFDKFAICLAAARSDNFYPLDKNRPTSYTKPLWARLNFVLSYNLTVIKTMKNLNQ